MCRYEPTHSMKPNSQNNTLYLAIKPNSSNNHFLKGMQQNIHFCANMGRLSSGVSILGGNDAVMDHWNFKGEIDSNSI